jgi:Co/Zn/Cd efflux system component
MAHALGVGVLGMILNVASAWTMRDGHPAWYLVVGVVTTMLWAWIGGRLARGAGAAPARAVA